MHFEQLVGRLIPPLPIEDFQLSAIIAQIDHKYVAVEPGIILLSRKVLCTHPKISQKCTNNISSGEMLPYLDKHPLFLFFFSFLHKTSRRSHSQMLYPNPYYNKVIALRGSTPKRESQQQCSCTNNTANHAMLCHTMTYNATPYNICNAIRCHTMQHHDHHAMQHHTTPFLAMQ